MSVKEIKIDRDSDQQQIFMEHLLKDINALEFMLEEGRIESGVQRIGAEQELCFVDEFWRPAPIIQEVLKELTDGHFTYEHAKFNAEINTDPLVFEGKALSTLEIDLLKHLARLQKVAEKHGSQAILAGILPTIRKSDLSLENLSPKDRYHALSSVQNKWKGGKYEFRIEGTDQLITAHDSTMLESCNTSFQIHLQVSPDQFTRLYNWAQLVSAPVLACATNSPLLLGKRLWRETRIALFQQAIDTRNPSHLVTEEIPRVSFGNKWIQNSVLELFREDVVRHRVLLHAKIKEDAFEQIERNRIPSLSALQIHNGTIYRWNRACYGITNKQPHIRIENRYLPAGPTIKDEVANAAFWLGLMNGIPDDFPIVPTLDFHQAKSNFIKAARMGLGAQFSWINKNRVTAKKLILKELLPIATRGLQKAKIDQSDIDEYLNIIKERVQSEKTGSQWMLDSFNTLKKEGTKYEALVDTTSAIVYNQKQNTPVHLWKPAQLYTAGGWKSRFQTVNQIMSRDLFVLREDDIMDLAKNVMDWQHIRHIPVQDHDGKLIGLVISGTALRMVSMTPGLQPLLVKDVMIKNPVTTTPETSTRTALNIMIDQKVGCLPVIDKGVLVGIITEHDFTKMLKKVMQQLDMPYHG